MKILVKVYNRVSKNGIGKKIYLKKLLNFLTISYIFIDQQLYIFLLAFLSPWKTFLLSDFLFFSYLRQLKLHHFSIELIEVEVLFFLIFISQDSTVFRTDENLWKMNK